MCPKPRSVVVATAVLMLLFVAAPVLAHGSDEHEDDGDGVGALLDEAYQLKKVDPQVALLGFKDAQLAKIIGRDGSALGSVSLGKPNGGALLNGVSMPESSRWQIVDPVRAFGTVETVAFLQTAINAVHEQFPKGTHPMFIGHLSRQKGGRLWPHRSHQSGRDVDLGYYYKPEYAEWYRPATALTIDRARSWAFVKALITRTDVEYIFISTRVQKILKDYAISVGEDRQWLDSIFEFRSRNPEPIIRHTY
ncbi:MAG: penicillin-insensitive murein endopeptidase, partial [Myxococcota bacterium]